MVAPGDFIGPYRVLSEVSRHSSSVTYLVEHAAQGLAMPLYLTTWPDVHLRSSEEARAFAEVCQQAKEQQPAAFSLVESGVNQEHPYMVLREYEVSQQQIALIDQQLQKSQSQPGPAVFSGPLGGGLPSGTIPSGTIPSGTIPSGTIPSGTVPSGTIPSAPISPPGEMYAASKKRSGVSRRVWVGAVAALLIIACCCVWPLYLSQPASSATLTLTPKSQHLQKTLTVMVYTQADQSGDIRGHAISYTTSAQTKTGKTTGKRHINATAASGEVVISNISLYNSDSFPVGTSTLTSRNGQDIILDGFTARQGATITVPAHAQNPGSRGNIPAYNINQSVVFCGPYDYLCNSPDGNAHAQNPHPFTGGTDARDEMYVQQADIDGLAQPLIPQLTADAQAGLTPLIAQQVLPGEKTVLPAPMCTPNIRPDHKVSEAATTVTVSVTVTCYQIAYASQDFLPGVIHAQQAQMDQTYHLVGDLLAESPVYSSTDPIKQTAVMSVKANSIWMYQVDDGQKADMARKVVGLGQDDARKLLLSTENAFLQDVTIDVHGFGNLLPKDAQAIQVTVQAVPGLHA